MSKFILAIATDDEINLSDAHFGDAKKYLIYEVLFGKTKLINKIENTSRRESEKPGHGDAEKAGDIKSLLKRRGVDAILGHRIGPNIKRIRKHFVPIVCRKMDIDYSIGKVSMIFYKIHNEINKAEKEHFVIR